MLMLLPRRLLRMPLLLSRRPPRPSFRGRGGQQNICDKPQRYVDFSEADLKAAIVTMHIELDEKNNQVRALTKKRVFS